MKAGIDLASVGYELRLGRVARENIETKARRYVLEGRLQIRYCGPEGVRALCRGQGAVYRLSYVPGDSWACTCAARGVCSHIIGAKLVVAVEP